jgi:hypothetical protein
MRTTVNLDEEVVRLVRSYARSRSLSLGKALGETRAPWLRRAPADPHDQRAPGL